MMVSHMYKIEQKCIYMLLQNLTSFVNIRFPSLMIHAKILIFLGIEESRLSLCCKQPLIYNIISSHCYLSEIESHSSMFYNN